MAFGTLELTLRPLKLAFLVDPTDQAAVNEAIQINTFLWGGIFNPIIPVFRRLPAVWRDRFHGHPTAKTLVTGYLNAFDPDFVVVVGKVTAPKTGVGFRETIHASEVLAEVKADGTPKFGVGLIEVLDHFAEQELKFVRHHPIPIRLPEWDDDYALFFSASFGALPNQLAGWFRKHYATLLPGIAWQPCSLMTYTGFLDSENLFLQRLSNLYIKRYPRSMWSRHDCIYFMDGSEPVDIIDFWNLRALGWNVIPVPKQAAGTEALITLVREFIAESCHLLRGNSKIRNCPTLLKSRCAPEAEMNSFWRALKSRGVGKDEESRIGFQGWQPPIWDEWAREHNNAQCAELESERRRYELHEPQTAQAFNTLAPSFASKFGGHSKPRFVNRIDLRVYGGEEPFTEAIPETDQKLDRTFDVNGYRELRFSQHGPVHLARDVDSSLRLAVPRAEVFFKAWMQTQGWVAELSDKGHIARQMLKQIGGLWGTQTLADEGIIPLLNKLTRETTMNAEAFRAELNRICQKHQWRDATNLAKRLVELNAVQLGLELQCPHCRQHSWFSITEADYELSCRKCLQRFTLPTHTSKKIGWSYRAIGPFSLPQHAYGAYTVLLSLRFFSKSLDGATTPLLSFTAKKGAFEIEADLGLFYQESRFDVRATDLIFVECKSYNDFTHADAKRMSALADQFPGAVLAFATLKRSLSNQEKKVLRPVVNRGRRRWKTERPYNPVMILTGVELFAEWRPEQVWKDAGGKHAQFADYNRWSRGELLALCDATQQIYLDLPSWDEWLERRRRRKFPPLPPMIRPPPASPPSADLGQPSNGAGATTSPTRG